MNHLELQAVGIGEEDRVIPGCVVVLSGWVEDGRGNRHQEVVESVDVRTSVCVECKMMKARRGPVVGFRLAIGDCAVQRDKAACCPS